MSDDDRIPPAMEVVRDLTQEEYDATYADGEPHELPANLIRYLENASHNTQPARSVVANNLSLPYIPSKAHGNSFNSPCHIRVIHCTEGPMSRGNARALAGPNWFGGPAGTSAHDIFDPGDGVEMVKPGIVAYHVGPAGNGRTRGTEHCGRVAFTRAQWTTADGMEMITRSARYNAAAAHRDGVLPRWLSLTQLARGESGFCTHNDVRLALGGTTHSDPGPNFPYDIYMDLVNQYYNGVEEDDVSVADVEQALKNVLHIDNLAVPKGQQNNNNLAAILVGGTQQGQNADNAIKAAIAAVKGDTAVQGDDEAKILAKLTELQVQITALLQPKV